MENHPNAFIRISVLAALSMIVAGCTYEPPPRPVAYYPVPCPPPGSQAVTPDGQPIVTGPVQENAPAPQCFIAAPVYPAYPLYPAYYPYPGYYEGGVWVGGRGRWR